MGKDGGVWVAPAVGAGTENEDPALLPLLSPPDLPVHPHIHTAAGPAEDVVDLTVDDEEEMVQEEEGDQGKGMVQEEETGVMHRQQLQERGKWGMEGGLSFPPSSAQQVTHFGGRVLVHHLDPDLDLDHDEDLDHDVAGVSSMASVQANDVSQLGQRPLDPESDLGLDPCSAATSLADGVGQLGLFDHMDLAADIMGGDKPDPGSKAFQFDATPIEATPFEATSSGDLLAGPQHPPSATQAGAAATAAVAGAVSAAAGGGVGNGGGGQGDGSTGGWEGLVGGEGGAFLSQGLLAAWDELEAELREEQQKLHMQQHQQQPHHRPPVQEVLLLPGACESPPSTSPLTAPECTLGFWEPPVDVYEVWMGMYGSALHWILGYGACHQACLCLCLCLLCSEYEMSFCFLGVSIPEGGPLFRLMV